ncbi:uncharacterized protein LOC143323420 [Chaetodon auriga]|uniref:uncharacterized protein LOC143323420 n=1 Tax=Chaetodon auriga TaxID=39042 RepID=UPI004032D000
MTSVTNFSFSFFFLFCTSFSCGGCVKTGVSGGIIQPSAGTSVGGAGVPAPSGVGTAVQQPGGVGVGTGVKAPKPVIPGVGPGVGGYPYGGTFGVPFGVGPGTGAATLPGAKPLKPPVGGAGGGVGIPLAAGGYQGGYRPYHHGYGQGGLTYPSAAGQGGAVGVGAKPPKPGYGSLGGVGGFQQAGVPVVPGYGVGYPQQYYPGGGLMHSCQQPGGYVPAPLTPQQAKAAKYGPLQGFLGGAGGGGVFRGGVAGCQGKYCGRRK